MTNKNITTISELIAELNTAVLPFTNIRVSDSFSKGYTYSNWHDDNIRAAINPILAPFSLQYRTWGVCPIEPTDGHDQVVLTLDIERRLDKGQEPHGVRGRVISIAFLIPADLNPLLNPSDPIDALILARAVANLAIQINNNQQYRDELRAKLEESTRYYGKLVKKATALRGGLDSLVAPARYDESNEADDEPLMSVSKKQPSAISIARSDWNAWIEERITSNDFSYRGGSIKVDVSDIFPKASDPVIGAYQNYLGGGIAGRIVGAAMFLPDELNARDQKIFHEVKDAIVAYVHAMTNGGGDEYMQENYGDDLEFNQNLPISAY